MLIADDHSEVRRLWALNLSARGYEVVEATDGKECLTLILQEQPDVILLDLSMPVLSGWEVLRALKERSVASSAPVIVVTGWADGEVQDRARRLGASCALIKLFGVELLLLKVQQAVSGVSNEGRKDFRS